MAKKIIRVRVRHKRYKGNPNPSPSTRFKKGVRVPGSGRKPETITRRELRKYTRGMIAELYNKLTEMNREELRVLANDEQAPMIECVIAAALLEDRLNGNVNNTDKILDRAIGRVATELTGLEGIPLVPPAINFIPVAAKAKKADVNKALKKDEEK